jgi:hypothetical protein
MQRRFGFDENKNEERRGAATDQKTVLEIELQTPMLVNDVAKPMWMM